MKKILSTLALVFVCISTSGQGTIFFNNRTSAGDYPVYLPGGTTGAGLFPGGASAQLFLAPEGGGAFIALNPATTFRSGAAASPYVNPVDVTVPGIPAGTPATVVMRVWATSYGSLEAAQVAGYWGQSAPLTIAALGGVNPTTGAIVPTPDLAGLNMFVLVPEPSTISLGVLGLTAAFLVRRRGTNRPSQ